MPDDPAKPSMPEGMHAIAAEAEARHYARPSAPGIVIEKTEDGEWRFASPYAAADEDRWAALLYDALGTRSPSVVNHFLETFTRLCRNGSWDEQRRYWQPNESDFNAVLAIVGACRPENEAQAAYAAQLAALHLSAMQLGEAASNRFTDSRTIAVLNKTVRAFGDGIERLARIQGKVQPRTVNQTIQVVYVDKRDQRSAHFTGGQPHNGGQPHAADAGEPPRREALPRPRADDGAAMPLASCSGKEGVPNAWRSWWRAIWPGQWKLSTRRLDA